MKQHLQTKYPLLLRDGAFFIDNSSMEKVITCPRSALFYMAQKRELAGRSDALNFGSGMHEGMAVRYKDFFHFGFNDKDSMDRQIKAITDHFDKNPQDSETFRTVDRAIDMMLKYDKTYKVEPFIVHSNDTSPLVEIPFAVPIGQVEDVPIIWTGRIDAVIFWDRLLWILDHKTTSIFGGTYFEQFRNASQFIGYCWAYEQISGQRVNGVLINALAIRKITPTGKPVEFARERIDYNRDQIDEWQTNTMHVIKNFLQMAAEEYFPAHTAWCHNKFGTCQYFEVCTLPIAQRPILLGSRAYKDVTWNPLD